jgi:hypothetical protein
LEWCECSRKRRIALTSNGTDLNGFVANEFGRSVQSGHRLRVDNRMVRQHREPRVFEQLAFVLLGEVDNRRLGTGFACHNDAEVAN